MSIPFLDLRAATLELRSSLLSAIERVLDSGWYIGGGEVDLFEREFAKYVRAEYCKSVANGLDSLTLALQALGVTVGDEVIVPANTFIATWLAVSRVGAVPVPVDPNPETHTIEASGVIRKITSRTKAVIPVHLYGQPVDLNPILEVARMYGLWVVEDAAQAHGAKYRGQPVGAHGDVVCWSFYPGKNLGALGDGGAVTTNRWDVAEKIHVLRNYGSDRKYIHEVQGVNSRLDPIQAAILREKLQWLDEWNARRKRIASLYMDGLRETHLKLPVVPDYADPVWHLFVVQTHLRDKLVAHLSANGVGCLVHYPVPPHLQGAYRSMGLGPSSFPITEGLAEKVLSLPIGPHLTDADCLKVVEFILDFDKCHT